MCMTGIQIYLWDRAKRSMSEKSKLVSKGGRGIKGMMHTFNSLYQTLIFNDINQAADMFFPHRVMQPNMISYYTIMKERLSRI